MATKLSGVRRADILTGAILRELRDAGFDLDEALDGAGTTTAQLVRAVVVRDTIEEAKTKIRDTVFREFDAEAWDLLAAFAAPVARAEEVSRTARDLVGVLESYLPSDEDDPAPDGGQEDYGAWHEDDDSDDPVDDAELYDYDSDLVEDENNDDDPADVPAEDA